jgi:hypothetical protein
MNERLGYDNKNEVDEPFSCIECDQEFNSHHELKEHESTQH